MKILSMFLVVSLACPVGFSETVENLEAARPKIDRSVASEIVADKVAVPVSRQVLRTPQVTGNLKNWTVTDTNGQDVKSKLSPRFDAGNLTIATGDISQFAIKPKRIDTRVLNESRVIELPGGLVLPKKGTTDEMELYSPTVIASPLPAIWNFEDESYSTKITFGLKSTTDGGASRVLDEPIEVRFSFRGLSGEEPPPMRLTGVGLDNEESFVLRFKPTTTAPALVVRSSIYDGDLELKALSRLALQAVRGEVLGFGLEQVVFNVSEFEPHGQMKTMAGRVPISVYVEGRSRVEPEQPAFEEGPAVSQFRVRSSGLGAMKVEARVGDEMAMATVIQKFPVSPLLAVLLGGALGGYARRFVKAARQERTGRWIVEGLLVSVIAFVAGVLGVGNLGLPSAVVATEAGAFLTGALSGFVGVVILEKLTSAIRQK